MPDPFSKPSKSKKFLKVLKATFLSKIPMNLVLLILIIVLSLIGFKALTNDNTNDTLTGNVILESKCPECVCEQTGAECEQDCDLCPIKTKVETKNIIYYKCPSGALVEDLEECTSILPNVTTEDSGTVEGVTLVIDDVEYEKDQEDSGFVTAVEYTIINKGDYPIIPKIEVKVYEEWTLKVKKS